MLETVVLLNFIYLFGTCDTFFQDSLINKKFKRTVFIQNRNFVMIYTTIQKFQKTYIVRKYFYFE